MSASTAVVNDRELVISRVFDAPRALVFAAWTDPAQLAQWYGPDGFSLTTSEFELAPGGMWRFVMHGPDGTDYPNELTFREIVPEERLVYSHGPAPIFDVTVTFAARGEQTEVTMRSVFPSAAALQGVIKQYNALEGGKQHLGRLAQYLQTVHSHTHARSSAMTVVTPTANDLEMVLTRLIDAPRELVFKAWTDPEYFAQWFGPRNYGVRDLTMDVRPGGEMFFLMTGPEGQAHVPVRGIFREIDPPKRLVYEEPWDETFRAMLKGWGFEGEPGTTCLVTIELEAQGGKTLQTVTTVYQTVADRDFHMKVGAPSGWGESFDKMEEFLATQR